MQKNIVMLPSSTQALGILGENETEYSYPVSSTKECLKTCSVSTVHSRLTYYYKHYHSYLYKEHL